MHRIEKMDVGPRQTGWVLTGEFLDLNPGRVTGLDLRTWCAAQVDVAFGQVAEHLQTPLKVVDLSFEHGLGIRRERIGVDRCHKNRMASR